MTSKTPLESAQACWDRISHNSPVYQFFFLNDTTGADHIILTHASHGFIRARLPVSQHHLNSKNGLHGSVSATIIDWAGGIAIASTGLESTGVSTDIHVSYVTSAGVGDVLCIEGRVVRLGRNLAFTNVTIFKGDYEDESTRVVVAHGSHTKYVLRDQPKTKDQSIQSQSQPQSQSQSTS